LLGVATRRPEDPADMLALAIDATRSIGSAIGAIAAGVGTIVAAIGTFAANVGRIGAAIGTFAANVGRIGAAIGTFAANVGRVGAAIGAFAVNVGKIGAAIGTIAADVGRIGAAFGTIAADVGRIGAATGEIGAERCSLDAIHSEFRAIPGSHPGYLAASLIAAQGAVVQHCQSSFADVPAQTHTNTYAQPPPPKFISVFQSGPCSSCARKSIG
jgi:hypothetical protein